MGVGKQQEASPPIDFGSGWLSQLTIRGAADVSFTVGSFGLRHTNCEGDVTSSSERWCGSVRAFTSDSRLQRKQSKIAGSPVTQGRTLPDTRRHSNVPRRDFGLWLARISEHHGDTVAPVSATPDADEQ